jgi:hypothetical protein
MTLDLDKLEALAKAGITIPHGGLWRGAMDAYRSATYPPVVLALIARVRELEEDRKLLIEALTPSAETKAEYIGEFKFSQDVSDHEGGSYTQSYTVPWTAVKEIMAAILSRTNRRVLKGDKI